MTPPPARYVIDASVGIKLVVEEPGSDDAHALLARVADDPNGRIYVPGLFYAECANVLWKHVKRLRLTEERAAENLSRLLALPVTELRTRDVATAALRLAIEHDISAYDATYVASAEHANAPLVTADGPLIERFRGKRPAVSSLSQALTQNSLPAAVR